MENQEKFRKDLRSAFALELALWPNLAEELPELVAILQNAIGNSLRIEDGILDLDIYEGRAGIYQLSFSGLCQACDEWLPPSWMDSFPSFAKFNAGSTNTIHKLVKLAAQVAHQPVDIYVSAPKIGYVLFTFDTQFVEHLNLTQQLIFEHDFKKIGSSANPKWSPGHDGHETVTAGSEIIVSSDAFWFFTQEIENFETIQSTPVTLTDLCDAVSAAVEEGRAAAYINIPADIEQRIHADQGAGEAARAFRSRREGQS